MALKAASALKTPSLPVARAVSETIEPSASAVTFTPLALLISTASFLAIAACICAGVASADLPLAIDNRSAATTV